MRAELFALACACLAVQAYPYYPYYYGSNTDTMTFGSGDSGRGGMVLSRYFSPYYSPRSAGGGMAAFMYKPQQLPQQNYYMTDRRRQITPELNLLPPQQNEVYPQQMPEKPENETNEIADPTEKSDPTTTPKTLTTPELNDSVEEVEEAIPKSRKGVPKRKHAKPVEDEEDDEYMPKFPGGTFFPMFFGYGGRSAQGNPGGPVAVANAYSTGRGGVASSHATAYGEPKPEFKRL